MKSTHVAGLPVVRRRHPFPTTSEPAHSTSKREEPDYSTSSLVLGHDGMVTFPLALHGQSAVYDPINFKMIVFGGESVSKSGAAPVTYAVTFLNQTYLVPLPRSGCP